MVEIFKSKEEKVPFWQFTSRQVGVAAAFGGLGFAARSLGLSIPLGGTHMWDPRIISEGVGAALAGPAGAIVIGILDGLPGVPPTVNIPYALTKALVVAIFFRYLKFPAALVSFWIAEFASFFVAAYLLVNVYKFLTFPVYLGIMTFDFIVNPIINTVLLYSLRRASPTVNRMVG